MEPSVREGLLNKISRERIGNEFKGCFEGPAANPLRALEMIEEFVFFCILVVCVMFISVLCACVAWG